MSPDPSAAALGFTAPPNEVTQPRDLHVEGTLPAWLTGSLLRNGPGDWRAGRDRLAHWFDGWALLHHFSFEHGHVRYTSRFLESEARRAAIDQN